MPTVRHPDRHGLHLRVVVGAGSMVGPGRAELLQGIAEHGSIAAAGRAMGMSYRRAWMLAEATAAAFGGPVVVASPGGAKGGRAELTPRGRDILTLYRAIESKAAAAVASELAALARLAAAPG